MACEVLIRLVVVPANHKNATPSRSCESHGASIFGLAPPTTFQSWLWENLGRITNYGSGYYAARARHRRYGLAVLGIAMIPCGAVSHLVNSQSEVLLGAMRRIYVAMATISVTASAAKFLCTF